MSIHTEQAVIARVTSNGQISLPAPVRKRWDVDRVAILDHGDHLVIRALPTDPVGSWRGRYVNSGPSTDALREAERAADARAER